MSLAASTSPFFCTPRPSRRVSKRVYRKRLIFVSLARLSVWTMDLFIALHLSKKKGNYVWTDRRGLAVE